MAFVPRKYFGQPFRVLVGLRPFFQSVQFGQIQTGNRWTNGLMVENVAGILPETASFTVADNDFSGGRVEIILGDYTLISGIDYAVGAAVGNTATNIAAAITRLTGFTATALGAVVNIEFDIGMAHKIDFRVNHYGTVTNFTPLVPATDYMTLGSPSPGSVDIN